MSKVGIVLGIFVFYAFIIVIFGLMGKSEMVNSKICNNATLSSDCANLPSSFTFLSSISFFFQGINFTLSSIPGWANFLLFFPLGITLLWAVLP